MKGVAIERTEMSVKYYFDLDDVISVRINRKTYYTSSSTYIIFNYDKRYMSFDDNKTGLYRSIIFSNTSKEVVCFSPPKSIQKDIFTKNYPVINDKIWINQIIEGVAINLFYDNNINKWLISTKNSIGGKYWFYGSKRENTNLTKPTTFLEMFIESLRGSLNQELNDLALLEYFPKNYCYNFVMQHQSNSIILPVNTNSLYLVGVYRIEKNLVEYVPQSTYESWNIFNNLSGIIHFPGKVQLSDYNKIDEINSDNIEKVEIIVKGYMVTNMETGERAKLISRRYDSLTMLLNIKPKIQYQFLCLYRIGKEKIDEYLTFYPSMKHDFHIMRYLLEQFIRDVHQAYLSKYVYKNGKHILKKYESHVYKIHHTIYLPALDKHTIARVRYKDVVEYFNKMEPRELIYLLNWDVRKENLEPLIN